MKSGAFMNEIKKRKLWEINRRVVVIPILLFLHLIPTSVICSISNKTRVKTTKIHENHGHWHKYRKFSLLITGVTLTLFLIPIVSAQAPTAAFSGTPTTGQAPLTVAFTDQSTGSPTGWAWFFGDENYTGPWTEVNASAGWMARIHFSSVAMPDGSLVIMGGTSGGPAQTLDFLNDTWRSTDNGATWTEQTASAGWTARNGQTSVAMPDGSIVLMGGWDGNSLRAKGDVWRSTDNGATWTEQTASAGWTARYEFSSVAMPDGSIVMMGGSDGVGTNYNDVWRSTDNGATWTEMNASAGWTPREEHTSVAMPDGSIVLMGGLEAGNNFMNDVWRSTDEGTTWTEMNASAGWSPRYGHTSVAMPDGSIVLMGGWDGSYRNDVWRSTDDGATWTQVNAGAGWPGRWSQSSAVMPDGSIVLMGGVINWVGGVYTEMNDVWRLMPVGSFAQNPSHTYTTPGVYNVALQAYNAVGYNSSTKTGYITVTGLSRPVVNFIGTPTQGTAPLTVSFTDLSSNNPNGWAWFFNDNNFTAIWTQQTTHAGWSVRDGHTSVAMPDGSIVLMGGENATTHTFYNDVWRSTDNGATWTEMNASAGWTARIGHSSVAMPDGSIVLMGGLGTSGKLMNDTWRSTDNGVTWTEINASSGWSPRDDFSSVVMSDGSIVLIGGFDGNPNDRNDVWRSTDNGAHWTLMTASAGWYARDSQSSVVMSDGSIVLMGGEDSNENALNDVWRSIDNGATWTEQTASAGWTARLGQTSVVMPDGSIVLMGGYDGGANWYNDTWRSMDNGATWTEVNASSGWPARDFFSSVAMPDGSIVLMGGWNWYGPSDYNDVWRMTPGWSFAEESSEQNPSHTYTTPGVYNVALQAYNSAGSNSTLKIGYITVTGSISPTVTSVNPNNGPISGGNSVTLTGTGFTGATLVTFGPTPATNVTVINDTTITATNPAEAVGTVNVTVTNPIGTSATSPADQYTYTVPQNEVPLAGFTGTPTSGYCTSQCNIHGSVDRQPHRLDLVLWR